MKKFIAIQAAWLAVLTGACVGEAPVRADVPPTVISASSPTVEPVSPAPEETQPAAESTSAVQEPAPAESEAASVSFANDIVPILEAKCIKCHGVESKKEGLDLRTYDDILKGSRNGPVIVPGNANESLFVTLIIEGEMPNRGEPVTPEELRLIMDWVNQGALNN
jgi:hypothetical protein